MPVQTLWRITPPQYAATAFSGIGAEQYGGRFNSRGRRVAYTSGSLSLALLELLVQAGDRRRIAHYQYRTALCDSAHIEILTLEALPEGWDGLPYSAVSQAVGDVWLDAAPSLVLRVPSVVVPEEFNYLINPLHPAYSTLKFTAPQSLRLDPRLV